MDLSGESVTAVNAAVAMSKLLQISSGAVYTDDGDTFEFDIKNRYNVLKEVIDESSQKVLIFVPFKHTIDILTDRLLKDGITTEVIAAMCQCIGVQTYSSGSKNSRHRECWLFNLSLRHTV
jgi:hypothetical protein